KEQFQRGTAHHDGNTARMRSIGLGHPPRARSRPRYALVMDTQIFWHGPFPAEAALRDGRTGSARYEESTPANPVVHGLKRRHRKKALGPAEKRELVGYVREDFGMSLRQACATFNISTSVFYYRAKRRDDTEVIEQLSKLAALHRTWGFWMMYHRLRKLQL